MDTTLAEIKTFLYILKAEAPALIKEIEAFTQSFGGSYASFSIDAYIVEINNAVNLVTKAFTRGAFDMAMPPKAVVKYLKMYDRPEATVIEKHMYNTKHLIIGVGSPSGTVGSCGGLLSLA